MKLEKFEKVILKTVARSLKNKITQKDTESSFDIPPPVSSCLPCCCGYSCSENREVREVAESDKQLFRNMSASSRHRLRLGGSWWWQEYRWILIITYYVFHVAKKGHLVYNTLYLAQMVKRIPRPSRHPLCFYCLQLIVIWCATETFHSHVYFFLWSRILMCVMTGASYNYLVITERKNTIPKLS